MRVASAPATDIGWEIIAVRYGMAESSKGRLYHRFADYGDEDAPQNMDFYFYVLRRPDQTVLVDTGFDLAEAERRPGRRVLTPPSKALELLAVDPAAVTDVIVTHIHWDHIGNLDLFPAARLHVPEVELDFWSSPISRRPQFAEHTDLAATDALLARHGEGRVEATGARSEPVPGITAVTVGGHAPGQQILEVDGTGGPVALASDAAHLYEELELERPFGVLADLQKMYEAYEVLKGLEAAGATLVAGHDPEVTKRFPTLTGAAEGIGFQIA
jgi:glyoxylase-like metal-dependent hydrolase (beta-lactamase superfamily II)